MKPGATVCPRPSITTVRESTSRRTSWVDPMAAIRPSLMATASAVVPRRSMVLTFASSTTRSAATLLICPRPSTDRPVDLAADPVCRRGSGSQSSKHRDHVLGEELHRAEDEPLLLADRGVDTELVDAKSLVLR